MYRRTLLDVPAGTWLGAWLEDARTTVAMTVVDVAVLVAAPGLLERTAGELGAFPPGRFGPGVAELVRPALQADDGPVVDGRISRREAVAFSSRFLASVALAAACATLASTSARRLIWLVRRCRLRICSWKRTR